MARLAGVDEQRATGGVDALVRAEVLRAVERVGFTHPLFAAAVYNDLNPFDRARTSARLRRSRLRGLRPIKSLPIFFWLLHAVRAGLWTR